jgi:hypothetical protein
LRIVQSAQTASPNEGSLLEELDTRQDEVLVQLENLNSRIEHAISSWLAKSSPVQDKPVAS